MLKLKGEEGSWRKKQNKLVNGIELKTSGNVIAMAGTRVRPQRNKLVNGIE